MIYSRYSSTVEGCVCRWLSSRNVETGGQTTYCRAVSLPDWQRYRFFCSRFESRYPSFKSWSENFFSKQIISARVLCSAWAQMSQMLIGKPAQIVDQVRFDRRRIPHQRHNPNDTVSKKRGQGRWSWFSFLSSNIFLPVVARESIESGSAAVPGSWNTSRERSECAASAHMPRNVNAD